VVNVSNSPDRRTFVIRLSDGAMEELGPECSQTWGVTDSGRHLVAQTEDGPGSANVCDLDTGAVVGTLPASLPRPGWLSADGSVLLSEEMDDCGWYHTLVLSDWRTGERFWSSDQPGFELPCDQLYSVQRFHPTSSAMVLQVHTLNVKAPGAVLITDGRSAPVRVIESAEYAVVF
jgi:hypothetical protein